MTTKARPNAVVYDIEILRCIPDKGKPQDPALEYCAGWEDHKGMGIGTLCAFDLQTLNPHVFLSDNLADFQALIQDRVIIGFNNNGFDDPILAAHDITGYSGTLDVLAELRAAMGEPRVYTRGVTRAGRSLDAVAAANLPAGSKKTMDGALAPAYVQQGRVGTVANYCLMDVMLTARLAQKAITGSVTDPVTRKAVELPAFRALVA